MPVSLSPSPPPFFHLRKGTGLDTRWPEAREREQGLDETNLLLRTLSCDYCRRLRSECTLGNTGEIGRKAYWQASNAPLFLMPVNPDIPSCGEWAVNRNIRK